MITKDTVYQLLKDKISSPISFMELATQLRLDSPGKRATKKILRALVSEGQIVRTRRGLYGLAEEMSLITGYFEAHRDGYGFVILDKPGERDVFIPARATFGAMDNDRVVARMENSGEGKGRSSGYSKGHARELPEHSRGEGLPISSGRKKRLFPSISTFPPQT